MRVRHIFPTCAIGAAILLAVGAAVPAMAEGGDHPGMDMPAAPAAVPAWKADRPYPDYAGQGQAGQGQSVQGQAGPDPQARASWLAECRRRIARRDSGIGGAVIGGVIGGVAGNRIAGRHHRTTGTIVGAAAGAVAGAVIDRAEDAGRVRDECESYLDQYYAAYSRPAGYGYGYGYVPATYAPGCACQQPMMMSPAAQGGENCTETVEYEYVDVPVRSRIRYIPRRAVPDKRIRIVPDKRIRQ